MEEAYKYPRVWSFPPLFTLQRSEVSRASQLNTWASILNGWCGHTHCYAFSRKWPVFTNRQIDRVAGDDLIAAILEHLRSIGRILVKGAQTYLLPVSFDTLCREFIRFCVEKYGSDGATLLDDLLADLPPESVFEHLDLDILEEIVTRLKKEQKLEFTLDYKEQRFNGLVELRSFNL
ncbi:ESCRT-II-domain-containing protein [Giardia muris]|uniref:ESCRT-II-domain-containing protein n=1 Tax=Giardia muris TaxID=5742 RepID=A0A4Z1T7E9_GIAMU|nr:ESCRT-II-domain-containing protein [Giardia muris]|eukprot:TNJ29067.1 ESCRT-II-domain-containing protein [Giardia muris]